MIEFPIRMRKVRKGLIAYVWRTGVITIKDQKYVGYSLTDAIKLYRKQYPKRRGK